MWPKHLIFLLFSLPLQGRRHCRALTATTWLGLLVGCGQQGALYLPTEPAAAQRATLPETLLPGKRTAPGNAGHAAGTANSADPATPVNPAKLATP